MGDHRDIGRTRPSDRHATIGINVEYQHPKLEPPIAILTRPMDWTPDTLHSVGLAHLAGQRTWKEQA